MPADFVVAQIGAVLVDLPITSVKTGVIAIPAIVSAVAGLAAAGRLPNLVGDPVMVASRGDRLLEPGAEALYIEALLPHASLLTRTCARPRYCSARRSVPDASERGGVRLGLPPRLLRFARPPWLTNPETPESRTIKCHH